MKTKIAVLGHRGFIGSSLCRQLGAVPVDTRLPNCHLRNVLDRINPTHLVYSVGRPSISRSFTDPKGDFDSLIALQSILASLKGICLVYLSTQAVYRPSSLPMREIDPVEPTSPYGYHKLAGEQLVHGYSQTYGFTYLILRLFSCYGPPQKNLFFWDVLEKQRPVVLHGGTGNEVRDYVHINDVCRAVGRLCELGITNTTINVGSGQPRKIADVAALLRPNEQIVFDGTIPPGYSSISLADVSKLSRIGIVASTDFELGVAGYRAWHRQLSGTNL